MEKAEKGNKNGKAGKAAGVPAESSVEAAEAEGVGTGGEAGATLFVKNLSFVTKEEVLRKAMAQGGKVKAVKVL